MFMDYSHNIQMLENLLELVKSGQATANLSQWQHSYDDGLPHMTFDVEFHIHEIGLDTLFEITEEIMNGEVKTKLSIIPEPKSLPKKIKPDKPTKKVLKPKKAWLRRLIKF